jgi:hypothetical protein
VSVEYRRGIVEKEKWGGEEGQNSKVDSDVLGGAS